MLLVIKLNYSKIVICFCDVGIFNSGGTEVDDISEFPYQLSLRVHQAHVCGASKIHCHWALTAGKLSIILSSSDAFSIKVITMTCFLLIN